ncbi:uncharacterized protein LOC106136836 [Amyelois transitella]|uniref:uncharacterized protein LOC106136836 n=1 Tax=Amyelois transitella TaxID=680683 RepID=UPI00298F6671|nr:uncharacterized protein LOC106136836 [Amyelois transitella]
MSEMDGDSFYSGSGSTKRSDGSSKAWRAASEPITVAPRSEAPPLKQQISAPSYFCSLSENKAPPFKYPEPVPTPMLLIGHIMSQEEAIAMIAAFDADKFLGLAKFLGEFLIAKNVIMNYNLSEKNFLISFLAETIDYAAQRDFGSFKLACLLTIYLDTHIYFKGYYWLPPESLWLYFKEIMIRHTIEDSPDGQEVFEPEECYDILTHFHTLYLSNLPLVHILTFGAFRLKLTWPFKAK